jgi:hypothetical protein
MMGNADAQCLPIDTFTQTGFYPKPDSIPCLAKTEWQQITLQFKNYKTFDFQGTNITINSITIDTLNNVPNVYCWITNSPNNTIPGDSVGCITFAGTTTSDTGQYKLKIYVSANTSIGPLNGLEASSLSPTFRFDLRVINLGENCPPIDTNKVGNTSGVHAPTACWTGLDEVNEPIGDLSNYPNPFNGTTDIVFVSMESKDYTFRVYNLLGTEVHSETVRTVTGQNTINFNAKNLESGVYFYSLSNGKHTYTNKMVVNK